VRTPENSTWHYTAWCNGLSEEDLHLQQYVDRMFLMVDAVAVAVAAIAVVDVAAPR
jgi:hypothetical protein